MHPLTKLTIALFLGVLFLTNSGTAQPAIQRVGDAGTVNWTIGTITAQGIGIIPANRDPRLHRRKIMARSAAMNDAYRNLAEVVGGIHIQADSNIKEMMVTNDRLMGVVRQFVRGARPLSVEWSEDGDDTVCTVVLEAPLGSQGGFASAILPFVASEVTNMIPERPAALTHEQELPDYDEIERSYEEARRPRRHPDQAQTPSPAPATDTTDAIDSSMDKAHGVAATESPKAPAEEVETPEEDIIVTGVLFNARKQNYSWSLFPEVKTEKDLQIFDVTVLNADEAVGFFTPYAHDVQDGYKHDRTKITPLVIDALGVDGSALVISTEDGRKLVDLNRREGILQKGRVVFIIREID
jgi:hypothetical protein